MLLRLSDGVMKHPPYSPNYIRERKGSIFYEKQGFKFMKLAGDIKIISEQKNEFKAAMTTPLFSDATWQTRTAEKG